MSTSIINGFGIDLKGCSNEQLIKFFLAHKESLLKCNEGGIILDYIENSPNKDLITVFEEYDRETNGDMGIFGLIADIMEKETGIRFEYRSSSYTENRFDVEDAILFSETFPWFLNKTEASLEYFQIDNIFKKYIAELGLTVEPTYINIKYFG